MDPRMAGMPIQLILPADLKPLPYWDEMACACLILMLCTPIATYASDTTKPRQQEAGLVGQVQRIVEETHNLDNPNMRIILTESCSRKGEINERIVALVYKDAPEKNTKQRTDFVRDDSGRTKEEKMYQDNGTLVLTQKYAYDNQGQLTQKISVQPDGTEESKWRYFYDSHGNEKEASYFMAGILKARYLYEYDKRGHRSKMITFRGDGSEEYTSIEKYDDKNRRIETVVYKPGGAVDRKHVYHYDKRGYLAEEIALSSDGSMTDKHVFSFEFDQIGNWIKRTRSTWTRSSGKVEQTEIAERRISYYSN